MEHSLCRRLGLPFRALRELRGSKGWGTAPADLYFFWGNSIFDISMPVLVMLAVCSW